MAPVDMSEARWELDDGALMATVREGRLEPMAVLFEGSAFVPWMFSVARRLHIDHATRHAPETPLEDWHEASSNHEDGAHHNLEQQADRRLLARALARLTHHKRQLLLLSKDSELSYRDLASIFGCSEGAVKVQVHRALKELRSAFQELQGGAL